MKVLLLEDDARASREIEEGLGAKGISVAVAQDPAGCLEKLQGERDSAILVDLDCDTNGVEALQKIHSSSPDSVLIVMASLERLPLIDEALRRGAWDYVVKPPDLSPVEEIFQTLVRNVGWKNLKSENRAYREENQWLRMAMWESREGIFVADREGKVVFANPSLHHQLGYDGEDLIGEPIDRVVSSVETRDSSWTELAHPVRCKHWQGTSAVRRKDGSESLVRTKMTQILDEAGEAVALIGVCLPPEDVRPEVSAPAREGQAEWDVVLEKMTDELKTPLAAMIGYLEMALSIPPDRVEPHQILSIRRIEALARHLYDLITNHADALNIEAGRFEMHRNRQGLNGILEQAVRDRKSEAGVKNIEILLKTAEDLPAISVDAVQIQRAVGILISNAINLSPLRGEVTVASGVEADRVLIAVTGSGVGISEDEIPFLFDRGKKLRSGGAAIDTAGLFVAHHIVTAHGGAIEVHKASQGGSALTVSLPI